MSCLKPSNPWHSVPTAAGDRQGGRRGYRELGEATPAWPVENVLLYLKTTRNHQSVLTKNEGIMRITCEQDRVEAGFRLETGSWPCRSARSGGGGVLGLGPRLGVDSMPGWEVSKQPDNLTTDRKPAKKRKKSPTSDPCLVKRA